MNISREVSQKNNLQKTLHRGQLLTILSSLAAFIVFLFISDLITRIEFGSDALSAGSLTFYLMEFIWGIIFSVLPILLAGTLLAYILYQDFSKARLTPKKAFLKGAITGMVTGVLLSLLVFLVHKLFDRYVDNIFFLSRTIIVAILAFITGGLTGRRLFRFMEAYEGNNKKVHN